MKLEERICACGCGKAFRCLSTSPTLYSSQFCMQAAGACPDPEVKSWRKSGAPGAGPLPPKAQSAGVPPRAR